ncbi:MAG: hypothetical protein ACT4N2_12560 [Hyphomicrobium sp.]
MANATHRKSPAGDNVSADEQRLAAELAALLGNRLAADDGLVHPERAPRPPTSFAWRPSARDGFDEADEDGGDPSVPRGVSPATRATGSNTAVWLQRAKRQRRWGRLRRAGAWVVTLLIGGAIISAAAYLLIAIRLDLIA